MRPLAVLTLLLLMLAPARAQDAAPRAWLFDPLSGEVLRVENGTASPVLLPIPDGYALPAPGLRGLAASPDGDLLAYLVIRVDGPNGLLLLYRHSQARITATYPLSAPTDDSLSADAARLAFSPDSQRLAFGYHDSAVAVWELVVIDTVNNSLSAVLRSDTLTLPGALSPGSTAHPVPLAFLSGGRLAFALFSTDAPVPAYLWTLTDPMRTLTPVSGALAPTLTPNSLALDADRHCAPTNDELLFVAPDARLGGDALQVYDPLLNGRYPVFSQGPVPLSAPRYAASGRYALLTAESDAPRLLIIGRDGRTQAELPISPGAQVWGTGGGFALLDTGALRYYPLSEAGLGEPRLMWSLGPFSAHRLIWAADGLEGAPCALRPWPALAEPVLEGSTAQAAPTTAPLTLQVGGTATVSTTDGDSLNLRTAAGITFQISAKLPRGTLVTLLDGPIQADGFAWWQVRTADGVTGWAVASADSVVTLTPGTRPSNSLDAEDQPDAGLGSLLAIGDTVEVRLEQPTDVLRMRNGPALTFDIVALLTDRARLSVIDGPRQADGFTWWQVRTPEGESGWAVEIVGPQRTLVKLTVSVTTPTPAGAQPTTAQPTPQPSPTPAGSGLPAPRLIAPADGAVFSAFPRTMTLSWEPVSGAVGYQVQVEYCTAANDPSTCTAYSPVTVTDTRYTFDFISATPGRWRVTALDAAGQPGEASAWRGFVHRQ